MCTPPPCTLSTFIGTGPSGSQVEAAEQFTSALDGPLESIEVGVRKDAFSAGPFPDLTVRLYTFQFNRPLFVLAEGTVPAAAIGTELTYVTVDLSGSGVLLAAGTEYAVGVAVDPPTNPPGDTEYLWSGESGNPFPEGEAYRRFDGGNWVSSGNVNDYSFVVEVADPPVPGPGAGLAGLAALALVALGVARLRRRNA